MTKLHFQPIRGRALDMIGAIIHTPEAADAGGERSAVHLVVEELVANVTCHAYPAVAGGGRSSSEEYLDVEIVRHEDRVTLCFRDGGTPFNPLQAESPDTSLPLAQRRKGGLGIFLVKKEADAIAYEYTGGENVLTVSFYNQKIKNPK